VGHVTRVTRHTHTHTHTKKEMTEDIIDMLITCDFTLELSKEMDEKYLNENGDNKNEIKRLKEELFKLKREQLNRDIIQKRRQYHIIIKERLKTLCSQSSTTSIDPSTTTVTSLPTMSTDPPPTTSTDPQTTTVTSLTTTSTDQPPTVTSLTTTSTDPPPTVTSLPTKSTNPQTTTITTTPPPTTTITTTPPPQSTTPPPQSTTPPPPTTTITIADAMVQSHSTPPSSPLLIQLSPMKSPTTSLSLLASIVNPISPVIPPPPPRFNIISPDGGPPLLLYTDLTKSIIHYHSSLSVKKQPLPPILEKLYQATNGLDETFVNYIIVLHDDDRLLMEDIRRRDIYCGYDNIKSKLLDMVRIKRIQLHRRHW